MYLRDRTNYRSKELIIILNHNTNNLFRIIVNFNRWIRPPSRSFFNRAFRGGQSIYVLDSGANPSNFDVFEMPDESTGLLTAKSLFDINTPANNLTVDTGGNSWHWMDLGTSWFAVNDQNVVFKTAWVDSTKIFIEQTSKFTTGCVWRGRCFTAGLDTTAYWNSTWITEFDKLNPLGSATYRTPLQQPKANFVCYGPVGRAGIVELFLPNLVFADGDIPNVVGGHTSSKPLFMDLLYRGDFGFYPMDWTGLVLKLHPMRDGVVVYGDSRISALVPANLNGIPGFGLIEQVHEIGMASRSAVGGGLKEHLFLDNQGVLWLMDVSFQVTRLGYKEFLSGFLGEDITITYDKNRDAYYISGTTVCYRWTRKHGLSKSAQLITSGWQSQAAFNGIVKDTASPTTVAITLPPFKFPGAIRGVEIIATDTGTTGNRTKIAVDHRKDLTSSFNTATLNEVDETGYADITSQGMENRIRITHSDKTKLELDDVVVVGTEGKTSVKELIDG